jgi:APA family basic amino acid/polyamine antiporter
MDAWRQALPEDRLARLLTLTDAVVIGLGAMIGAGIFAAPGPAAEAAGSLLFIGLALAGIVAYANATSSAPLAAVYPESGGTYVYASERLGPFWGFLAGWGFIIGKTASLAAMALTLGSYAFPDLAGVELPPEQVAVVAPELRGFSSDDLEVHNWLSHGESFPAALYGRRVIIEAGCPQASSYKSSPLHPDGPRAPLL